MLHTSVSAQHICTLIEVSAARTCMGHLTGGTGIKVETVSNLGTILKDVLSLNML